MQWTQNKSVQAESEVRSSNPQTQSSETPWQDNARPQPNQTKPLTPETDVNNIYLSKEQEIMVNQLKLSHFHEQICCTTTVKQTYCIKDAVRIGSVSAELHI